MTTYVLLHGSGSSSWHWHLVVAELERRGRAAIAVDLPCDDDTAGLEEYAGTVVEAVEGLDDLVVVAQSLAGFTAPLVCARRPVGLLVLVNAMVPLPGETAGEWWAHTGHTVPDPFDPVEAFLHDVPAPVAEASAHHLRRQSDTVFADPWPLERWPDVPTRFLASQDDRFFPVGIQRRVVLERLGFLPDEIPGGHLPALSRPRALVERLEDYRSSLR